MNCLYSQQSMQFPLLSSNCFKLPLSATQIHTCCLYSPFITFRSNQQLSGRRKCTSRCPFMEIFAQPLYFSHLKNHPHLSCNKYNHAVESFLISGQGQVTRLETSPHVLSSGRHSSAPAAASASCWFQPISSCGPLLQQKVTAHYTTRS